MKVLFSEKLTEDFLEEVKKDLPFENERVAIKLHMGEPRNTNRLKPAEVKPFVDLLRSLGCEVFLFDSTVAYKGKRNSVAGYLEVARNNGFSEESMGCPVIIGDLESEIVKGRIEYEICKELCNTSVLVLTHVKGHVCAGIGGAIKNLGMGAVTKITKERIHEEAKPVYISGCVKCGRCVERCPENAIKLGKEGPVIDMERCHGCSGCILSCPVKALEPKTEIFDVLLTEAAMAAISKFRKVYYVNFLVRMGKECDCVNKPVEIIVDDIGVLASSDILSIEQASFDLVKKKVGYDPFEKESGKSFEEQLRAAEHMNLGERNYELVKV